MMINQGAGRQPLQEFTDSLAVTLLFWMGTGVTSLKDVGRHL